MSSSLISQVRASWIARAEQYIEEKFYVYPDHIHPDRLKTNPDLEEVEFLDEKFSFIVHSGSVFLRLKTTCTNCGKAILSDCITEYEDLQHFLVAERKCSKCQVRWKDDSR